jgi:hypothetical protein
MTDQVKYLGLSLDKKLDCKAHLKNSLCKAYIAYWQCRRAVRKTLGLSTKVVAWLYTSVVRLILLYVSLVWWKRVELKNYQKRFSHLQRMTCSVITGCMRSSPTSALEVMLMLPPLNLFIKQEARQAANRLLRNGCSYVPNFGHSEVLIKMTDEMPLLLAPWDKFVTFNIFGRKFSVDFPTREDWSMECVDLVALDDLVFFPDGFLCKGRAGAGVFSDILNHMP